MSFLKKFEVTEDEETVINSTSLGNQRKWNKGDLWIKKDELGYEGIAEFVSSLVLRSCNIEESYKIDYFPCNVVMKSQTYGGCYSNDYKQGMQEKTLASFYEEYGITIGTLIRGKSCEEALSIMVEQFYNITGYNIEDYLRLIFTFDSFILNEDRHLNNIIFLIEGNKLHYGPIFDNGLSLLSNVRDYPRGVRVSILARRVKPTLLSRDFDKHLKLWKGEPFINRNKLLDFLKEYDSITGRAGSVLLYQINSGKFNHLFFN